MLNKLKCVCIDSVKFIPNLFSKHFENQLDPNRTESHDQNGTQPQGRL